MKFKLNIVDILFNIFIFTKQFYIFKSGSMQPSDLILIVSSIFWIFNRFKINKIDLPFIYFLILVYVINFSHFFINGEVRLITASFHWTYITLFIVFFRDISSKQLLNKIEIIFKLSIIFQLIYFCLGLGFYWGEIRYSGTFNDPNQFAFYLLISFSYIYLINYRDIKKWIFYYIIIIFLINESMSSGMLFATILFIVCYILVFIQKNNKYANLFIIPVLCVILFLIYGYVNSNIFIEQNSITRLVVKINNLFNDGLFFLIKDRNMMIIFDEPWHMLWGYSQNMVHEIHSTFFAIIFYYGLFGASLIVKWVYSNIIGCRIEILPILIMIIVESFFLLHTRQPFFWMIFILIYKIILNDKTVDEKNDIYPVTWKH